MMCVFHNVSEGQLGQKEAAGARQDEVELHFPSMTKWEDVSVA